MVSIYHILPICLTVDGHLGHFHFLAILNNASMNDFVWTYVFKSLGYIPRGGILGSYSNSILNILRKCQTVFQNDHTILQSHLHCTSVSISPCLYQHLLLSFFIFYFSHSVYIVSHCGFMLFFHLATRPGLWDLSSLTRDRTCLPAVEGWSLNHWTAREFPSLWF